MKRSNLNLRAKMVRAKPYQPKVTQSFETMRAAEAKRRRRRARNLALAAKGTVRLTGTRTHIVQPVHSLIVRP